jgi:CDP-glucose 4,6-dehydratase
MLGAGLLDGEADLAGGWNFGPGDKGDMSVEQLTGRMVQVWGNDTIVQLQEEDGPHEAGLLRLDISKAKESRGYEPLIDQERMIEWTVDWYRTCIDDPSQARAVTDQQIESYMGLLESGLQVDREPSRSSVSDQFDGDSGKPESELA